MRIILVFHFLFFLSQTIFSQQKVKTFLIYRLSIDKNDFFTGLALGCQTEKTVEILTFETGIIRSFFQSRSFPRVGVSSMYIVAKNQRVITGPLFQYHFSTVQLNAFTGKNGRVNYNDLFVGWSARTTDKIYFSTNILLGYQLENRFNILALKRNSIGTLGYSFVCGVGYVF